MTEHTSGSTIEEKLRNLMKCNACYHYLTPPMIQCEESHIICGVCSRNKSKCPKCELGFSKIKIPIISEAIHLFKFPCCFSDYGCTCRLSWDELLDHENECYWRLYSCPKSCLWKGRGYHLKQHFEEKHANCIVKIDGNQLVSRYKVDELCDTSETIHLVNLLCVLDKNFLYVVESDKMCICIALQYIGQREESELYDYTINIKNSNTKLYLTQTHKVLPDSARITTSNSICVSYAMLNLFRQNNDIIVELKINSKMNNVPKLTAELLNKLRCPVCLEYMQSVINLCFNGHSFCNNCRLQVDSCPVCRGPINNARNYTLENICQEIDFLRL